MDTTSTMEMATMITTIIVAVITSVIGPVVVAWIKSKFVNKPKAVDEAIAVNALVDEQLTKLMDKLGANRVWVAQFHNGGNFYPTKKSIQKFSIFYEKISLNTAALSPLLQNIPASLFPRALDKIKCETLIEIPYVSAATDLFGMDSIIIPLKTKSLYMFGIYALDNTLIGVMGIAYNEDEHVLTMDEHNYVTQKIGSIGTLLSEYLYTVKKS